MGGGAAAILVKDGANTGSIARAGSRLYYPARAKQWGDYAVAAVPVEGGPPSVVFSYHGFGGAPQQGYPLPTWVAAWHDNVVIAAGGDEEGWGSILATVTPAGASTYIMDDRPGGKPVFGLVVNGELGFFLSCWQKSEVFSVPLKGGTPTKFAGVDACESLAVDSNSVYVRGGGKLWASPRPKPGFVPIADAPDVPGGPGVDVSLWPLLLTDDCYLYWIGPQGLMRMRKPM